MGDRIAWNARGRRFDPDTLHIKSLAQFDRAVNCILKKKASMAGVFKYMIDDNGEKTSVVVPIKTWQKLNESYSRLQKKLDVLIGIKRAITEIKEAGTPAKNYNL